jgi:prophage regulatory protein
MRPFNSEGPPRYVAPARLIRLSEVVEMVGLCRSAIYQRMNAGDFPKLVKLGRASRWHEEEVRAWVEALERRA